MVGSDDGPAITQLANVPFPGIDHRFDGESHPASQYQTGTATTVVQHLGFLVKGATDAMATKFAYDAVTRLFGKMLDGVTDVSQMTTGSDATDAVPEGLVGQFAESPCLTGNLSDIKHSTGIPMKPILDDGDVKVDDIPVFQDAVTGNAVAYLVIDGSAD